MVDSSRIVVFALSMEIIDKSHTVFLRLTSAMIMVGYIPCGIFCNMPMKCQLKCAHRYMNSNIHKEGSVNKLLGAWCPRKFSSDQKYLWRAKAVRNGGQMKALDSAPRRHNIRSQTRAKGQEHSESLLPHLSDGD